MRRLRLAIPTLGVLFLCLNVANGAPRIHIRQIQPQQQPQVPPQDLPNFPLQNFENQVQNLQNGPLIGPPGPQAIPTVPQQPQFVANNFPNGFPNVPQPQQPMVNDFQPPQGIPQGFVPPQAPQQQQLPPLMAPQGPIPSQIPQMIPQGIPQQTGNAMQFMPQQQLPSQMPQLPNGVQAQQLQPSPFASAQNPTEPPQQSTTQAPPTQATPKIVPPPVDKNVDLDGDGALSLTEVQYAAFVHHGLSSSVVENLFNQVDHNHDGYLTSIEFNDIRPLVLAKAENAAQRYLQNVDTDKNGLLSLSEAQAYILKEYGISNRDVERIWRLVVPSSSDEMDAVLFSKLRRRIRGMSIRLARQIMKTADKNEDGHIDLKEAQMIAFEQEGIGAGDVVEMLASVDDNNDNELNAPEFADFERIVRARSIETSSKALKVVDTDGSGTLTMDEAKNIAFDHYGFDERTLEPFFAQADENEDGALDAVEFAGFRSVIRARAVKNAAAILPEVDLDNDGQVSNLEAEEKARREDDMEPKETFNLFSVADQDKSGSLDRVELADFVRLVRLSAIKYASDHFREFDLNHDKRVTVEELQQIIEDKYQVDPEITREFFDKVDVDQSADLSPGEIVDFRHEIRKYVAERNVKAEIEAQNKKDMDEIEEKLRKEAEDREKERRAQFVEEEKSDPQEASENDPPRRHPVKAQPTVQKDSEWKPINTEDGKIEPESEKALANQEEAEYEVDEDPSKPKDLRKFQDAEEPALSRENRENNDIVETPQPTEAEQETTESTQVAVDETGTSSSTATPEPDATTVKHRRRKGKKQKTTIASVEETTAEITTAEAPTTEATTVQETTALVQGGDGEVKEGEEEYEEEETTPTTTTTTEKPKKKRRRLKKKTTTPPLTTTTQAAEYEEGAEYEEEVAPEQEPAKEPSMRI